MHCPDCGTALPRRMKFCTRCGAQLTSPETTAIKTTEERFDEYLEGLFWITVFGLGIVIGGAVLLTKVLHLNRGIVIAYLVLSSIAFMINFGLNLWGALRLARSLKKADGEHLPAPRDTNKMLATEGATPGESAHSVTENTTRSLEPIPK
ncbi:MAG: zinc ribbon domain-containing protein [Acidobacteria bacterium]|nr:zinc ribbon domain-containing protein [Acidobacteriota bacterium]